MLHGRALALVAILLGPAGGVAWAEPSRPVLQFMGASDEQTHINTTISGGTTISTLTTYGRPIPLDSDETSGAIRIHWGDGRAEDLFLLPSDYDNPFLNLGVGWWFPNNHPNATLGRLYAASSPKALSEWQAADQDAFWGDVYHGAALVSLVGGGGLLMANPNLLEGNGLMLGLAGWGALTLTPALLAALKGQDAQEHMVKAVRLYNAGE